MSKESLQSRSRHRNMVFFLTLSLLIIALPSCSSVSQPQRNGLIYRLKNRGPVPLSSDNPFLAANLLISKEMEGSAELAGFVRHRGAPAAIEIEKSMFSPLVMQFYYPENREQFTLEKVETSWFIRGPVTIEKEKFDKVADITRLVSGEPRLEFNYMSPSAESGDTAERQTPELGNIEIRRSASSRGGEDFTDQDSSIDLKLPEQEPLDARASSAFQSPSRRVFSKPMDEHQRIREIVADTGNDFAEMTPKGDLVHYVTYPGETLSMIARWYTGDRANVGRLTRMNRLSHPNHLEIGDTLIIPSYLIRNQKRLTEEAVLKLQLIASEGQ